jgi:hypothetical protein
MVITVRYLRINQVIQRSHFFGQEFVGDEIVVHVIARHFEIAHGLSLVHVIVWHTDTDGDTTE